MKHITVRAVRNFLKVALTLRYPLLDIDPAGNDNSIYFRLLLGDRTVPMPGLRCCRIRADFDNCDDIEIYPIIYVVDQNGNFHEKKRYNYTYHIDAALPDDEEIAQITGKLNLIAQDIHIPHHCTR